VGWVQEVMAANVCVLRPYACCLGVHSEMSTCTQACVLKREVPPA